MRVLWAKVGKPANAGKELLSQTPGQIVDRVMAFDEGTRVQIYAPIVVARKGEHTKEIEAARKSGFSKIRINQTTFDIFDELPIEKNKKNTISLVVDRLLVKAENRGRITKAIELSLKTAKGNVLIECVGEDEVKSLSFSTGLSDPNTGLSLPTPEPRLFSFNSPVGACPACNGLGYLYEFDPDLIVNDPAISIAEGALENWAGKNVPGNPPYEWQSLEALSRHFKFDLNKPFQSLAEKVKAMLFYGSGKEEIQFSFKGKQSNYKTKKAFEGIVKDFERKQKNADQESLSFFDQFIARHACEE
jgi:excinuclease ABC subunit A